jgi:DNA-binding CsgD family transcriptional regulator
MTDSMPSTDPDTVAFESAVGDALRTVHTATAAQDIGAALIAMAQRLGAAGVSMHDEAKRQQDPAAGYLVAHNVEFLREHAASPQFARDPVRLKAASEPRPFWWTTQWLDRDKDLAPVATRFREAGAEGGLMVPVFGRRGLRGTIGFCGPSEQFHDERRMSVLAVLAVHCYERLAQLSEPTPAPEDAPRAPLAPREIECLHWTAAGKTSWEIAEILGLSERTVESYLKTAGLKLGTSSRTQAVALAIRQGLIL